MKSYVFAAVVALGFPTGCALHLERTRLAEQPAYDGYAGEYQMGTNLGAIVRPEGHRLMVKVTGQDYFEIFPSGGDSFFFKVVDARLTFTRSEEGAVSGFVLYQNEARYRFVFVAAGVRDDFSRRIDAGGYRVRMMFRGRGAPTVVFEAGMGGTLDGWENVAQRTAEFTSVIAYDRAGLGLSERAATPRTAGHVAEDLHQALRNARVSPPYLLVGESAGGVYARVFAHRYSREVCGLVLVEPSSEEYEDWLHKTHPEAFAAAAKELEGGTQGFRDHVAAWDVSLRQASAAWPLPPVPLIVLTGMRHDPADADKRQMWLAMHERLVERVPGARHIVSPRSGHGLAGSEPELVVNAIREIVDKMRKEERQPGKFPSPR